MNPASGSPAPTIFVFARGAEETLRTEYNEAGRILLKRGFVVVSVDVPCHGSDIEPNEPQELDCWRTRFQTHGAAFMHAFSARVSRVLDFLIDQGITDPNRVAAYGTSRGGYVAYRFACDDIRVRDVGAISPITNPAVLAEFSRLSFRAVSAALSLSNMADRLAGRGVWLMIGNADERVGTDMAIEFSRNVVKASLKLKIRPDVSLYVMPADGHVPPGEASHQLAQWVLKSFGMPSSDF